MDNTKNVFNELSRSYNILKLDLINYTSNAKSAIFDFENRTEDNPPEGVSIDNSKITTEDWKSQFLTSAYDISKKTTETINVNVGIPGILKGSLNNTFTQYRRDTDESKSFKCFTIAGDGGLLYFLTSLKISLTIILD